MNCSTGCRKTTALPIVFDGCLLSVVRNRLIFRTEWAVVLLTYLIIGAARRAAVSGPSIINVSWRVIGVKAASGVRVSATPQSTIGPTTVILRNPGPSCHFDSCAKPWLRFTIRRRLSASGVASGVATLTQAVSRAIQLRLDETRNGINRVEVVNARFMRGYLNAIMFL